MKKAAHSVVEAHVRNVTLHGCIFLVAAAQSVAVEVALGQRLFKARTPHLVHVDRPDPCRETHRAHRRHHQNWSGGEKKNVEDSVKRHWNWNQLLHKGNEKN